MTIETYISAWHEDKVCTLTVPKLWMVEEVNSNNAFKGELSEESIFRLFDTPIGCAPLCKMTKGKKKIVIITDDLSRPTPTDVILPILINYLVKNGLKHEAINIISASGTHKPISEEGKKLKYGIQICANHRIVRHDCNVKKELKYIARSKFGTPIYVNKLVTKSDFLISIGGLYPAPPIGFSGGPKTILGICGKKTIQHLHYQRTSVTRGSLDDCTFKADLFDIARTIGLNFIINVLVSNTREVTHMFAGDLEKAYTVGTSEANKICAVRPPVNEHVVIANTYPFDTSLVFARKGWWPIIYAQHDALRIIIASSPEGIGSHGFWPFFPGRNDKIKHALNYYSTLSPKEVMFKGFSKLYKKIFNKNKTNSSAVIPVQKNKLPVLCYVPNNKIDFPKIDEMVFFKSWDKVLKNSFEYGYKRKLNAVFYHSSSLVYPKKSSLRNYAQSKKKDISNNL